MGLGSQNSAIGVKSDGGLTSHPISQQDEWYYCFFLWFQIQDVKECQKYPLNRSAFYPNVIFENICYEETFQAGKQDNFSKSLCALLDLFLGDHQQSSKRMDLLQSLLDVSLWEASFNDHVYKFDL